MKQFTKPPLSISDQIRLLQTRGLKITDESFATHCLENISYYRLGGYWYVLQSDVNKHIFQPGATFDQVIAFYNFDRELRLLLFDAIERIEISFRTSMIYHLSHEYDPWWFETEALFKNYQVHAGILKDIYKDLGRTEETFIRDHKKKYRTPQTPPAWKTIEIVSLGALSKLYSTLKGTQIKDTVARVFHLPNQVYLESWLNSLVVLRNLCAHHSRIYNRQFSFPPKTLGSAQDAYIKPSRTHADSQLLYYQLSFVLYLLNVVSPTNSFKVKLFNLLQQHPEVNVLQLGFTPNWKSEPLWQ